MRTAALVAAFAVVAAVAAGRMKHDFGALDGLATMVAPVAVPIRSSASVIPRLLDVARLPEEPYGGLIFLCTLPAMERALPLSRYVSGANSRRIARS